MIKKVILENKKYDYTYLDQIFYGLGHIEKKYNWLIADYECNYYPNDQFNKNRHHFIWLTGEQLNHLITKHKIQFIWGVFLAFDKDIKCDDVLKSGIPSSHINVIKDKVCMQNTLSVLEIIANDSQKVYIFSKINKYIKEFLLKFPEAKEL